MQILWLAIVFYSIGLGIVLQLRPSLMFHENGSWKEFGYQRDSRHTLFPFWLFAILWAFCSYAIAAAISWSFTGTAIAATTLGSLHFTPSQESNQAVFHEEAIPEEEEEALEEAESEIEEESIPVSRVVEVPLEPTVRPKKAVATPRPKPRQGYYVLEPSTNTQVGIRKYVYYGPSPPPE
jgi:hypothetical protein